MDVSTRSSTPARPSNAEPRASVSARPTAWSSPRIDRSARRSWSARASKRSTKPTITSASRAPATSPTRANSSISPVAAHWGEQLRYGQQIGVETLTRAVTDHIQEYTQTGGARPFGVALLVGGIDAGEPKLFETDPSGTDYEWKAAAIGGDRDTIQGYLEEHYREDLDVDGGIELAVSALSEPEDGVVNAEDVDVATITTEDESFHSVDTDHLESILAEIDETEEESDE